MITSRMTVRAKSDAARERRIDSAVDGAGWMSMVERAARANCTLLLTGETGVGKGYVARRIHERSARRAGPFVPVNCGAIPEALIDSQLFGHAKGAFSGAEKEHCGLVRAAEGGTLLLDEIADLPLTAQTRLLRLLEEREVQPVGYSRPVKVNVRIISATSADLRERVKQGTFREDLFYRLDVIRLHLPPLRERRDEIAPLLDQFNREFAGLYQQPALEFDREAILALEQHAWPGNVREVRTLIERLHVLCGRDAAFTGGPAREDDDVRVITQADLVTVGGLRIEDGPARAAVRIAGVGAAAVRIAELKLESINQALGACDGNLSRAASALGVHRSTLYRWLAAQQRLSA